MRAFAHSLLLILFVGTVAPGQDTPDHKWSGVVYADYYYNVARDTGLSALSNNALGGAKDLNGFMVRRVYLTFDKNLSSSFAMRFRLEADESAKASNGKIGSFVKDAYLKWKGIFEGSDLVFGIQPTAALEVSEKVWGYRSIEKTIMDLRKAVTSRDQGISLQGSVPGTEIVKYKIMYANGSANYPETDKYKRFSGRVEVQPLKNLVATAYLDLATRAPLTTGTGNLDNNTLTYAGFIGYTQKGVFAAGAEGFIESRSNGFVSGGTFSNKSGLGVSVFGSFVLQSNLKVLARYDMYDPNTSGSSKGDARNYIIAGLDWNPEGNVSIIPNILVETYESVGGVSVDASITGRVTLAYTF